MLSPILEMIQADLEPLDGKDILVLCSAGGEVPFWLAERMAEGHILGIELDDDLLKTAWRLADEKCLGGKSPGQRVEFRKAEKKRIPLESNTFDGLISEFIMFPTSTPTEIGQLEMARVLRPGGVMVITDIIITRPVTPEERKELAAIGLDYLCEGTKDDFHSWMQEAGLTGIEVKDLTRLVEVIWKERQNHDPAVEHQAGYSLLLGDTQAVQKTGGSLGKSLFYIYVRGTKVSRAG